MLLSESTSAVLGDQQALCLYSTRLWTVTANETYSHDKPLLLPFAAIAAIVVSPVIH